MANTKIEITAATFKGDWCNAQTKDNGEVSINLKSCPMLSKTLTEGSIFPILIEVNLVEKAGKKYGWDLSEEKQGGGGNKFQQTPEQIATKQAANDHTQRQIIAQSSLSASVQFHQGRTGCDINDVKKMATEFYNWVLDTSK